MLRSFVVTFVIFLNTYSHILADDSKQLPENTVIITAENWCPYTCMDTDKNRGLFVDILEAAFQEVGLQVRYDYMVSLNRAVQNIKNSMSDVLLGVYDDDHIEYIDIADEFYIYDETAFAVRKDSDVKLNEHKNLLNYKIGVISNYLYNGDNSWEESIEKHPGKVKVSGINGESHLITLLLRKRFDIAVVNPDVINYTLRETKQLSQIDIISKNILFKMYVGFAKTARGAEFRKKFKTGFISLKKTNKLKVIYEKYDIEMPDFFTSKY